MILRPTWTTQPQIPVGVDWRNPLVNGLAWLVHGAWWCPVTPANAAITQQNPAFKLSYGGFGAAYNGSNISLKLDKAPSGSSPAEVTMFCYVSVPNTSADYTILSQADNAANPLFRIFAAVGGQWTFNLRDNSTATLSITGGTPVANKPAFLVAVYRSGTAEKSFWADGVKKGTGTTAGGAITLTRASVGQLYRNTEVQYLTGTCPLAGVINRALSDAEVAALSANPWQIFAPLQRRIWSPGAGVAAGVFTPYWYLNHIAVGRKYSLLVSESYRSRNAWGVCIMFKNVAAKFVVFAFDATTNVPKTGDAANITAYVSKDYGTVTVLGDTTATEFDATNAPGYYWFDAAQAETNADCLMVTAKSATANIKVIGAPAIIYTRPTTGWLAPTVAGQTLDVSVGGEAGVDWANVGSPTTANALTATTIATTQKVDVDTIKTNPVVNAGTVTFPTTATLASTTNITAATGVTLTATTGLGNQTANITGNLSGSVGSVTNAVSITSNVKKNQALSRVEFLITDSTNHAPKTGAASIVATRSIDGNAFAAGTLSAVTEVSNGIYYIDFGAGDLNGNVITLRVTSTSNDDVFLTLITAP